MDFDLQIYKFLRSLLVFMTTYFPNKNYNKKLKIDFKIEKITDLKVSYHCQNVNNQITTILFPMLFWQINIT